MCTVGTCNTFVKQEIFRQDIHPCDLCGPAFVFGLGLKKCLVTGVMDVHGCIACIGTPLRRFGVGRLVYDWFQ